jgi:hypothetical protein
MIQKIKRNEGQFTQTGDVIVCNGAAECPLRDKPESQQQLDFARATGIWCPASTRALLEALMRECGFTGRELSLAWKAGSLGWDNEQNRLIIRAPLIEALFGWTMTALMVCYYVLAIAPIWLAEKRGLDGMLAFVAVSAVFIGCTWLLGRFIFRPRRVALRLQRVLADPDDGAGQA